ncbi:MAG: N-acetyl-gamma-glutamyl-phosphate reductase [Rhodothermia bacterium]
MNYKVGIVHGAGYVGRELIALVDGHPFLDLALASSDSHAGEAMWRVHPSLRQSTDLSFSAVDVTAVLDLDVVLLAGAHGTSYEIVAELLSSGFAGTIVDLTQDFRYPDATSHLYWTGAAHPYPELLDQFVYGLPEIVPMYGAAGNRKNGDNGDNGGSCNRLIANPGCFATAISLALWPVANHLSDLDVHVTAMTGASGAGSKPTATTHFPRRDGNIRAYQALTHRHVGEVLETTDHKLNVAFVPVSGPWTRGIWGTAQATLPDGIDIHEVSTWFESAYEGKPFVRLWNSELPELGYCVNTPYCDLGWTMAGSNLVVTFALDNLLKGAASQAIQNVNLSVNLPEVTGLVSPSITLHHV